MKKFQKYFSRKGVAISAGYAASISLFSWFVSAIAKGDCSLTNSATLSLCSIANAFDASVCPSGYQSFSDTCNEILSAANGGQISQNLNSLFSNSWPNVNEAATSVIQNFCGNIIPPVSDPATYESCYDLQVSFCATQTWHTFLSSKQFQCESAKTSAALAVFLPLLFLGLAYASFCAYKTYKNTNDISVGTNQATYNSVGGSDGNA